MPLHDWSEMPDYWHMVHTNWLVDLCRELDRRLPDGLVPTLGTTGGMTIDSGTRPDIVVGRVGTPEPSGLTRYASATEAAPDAAGVATLEAEDDAPAACVLVSAGDPVVAVLEVVSPRNKDRDATRDRLAERFAELLRDGVSLVLVDVHAQPLAYSFPDAIAHRLRFAQPATPSPAAAAWHSDGPTGKGLGLPLAYWRRPMCVGERLPSVPLPLPGGWVLPIDLEATYETATASALRRRRA